MNAKSLLVRMGADTKAMEAGFKKADGLIQQNSEKFKKAGRAITVAGAAIVGSIGMMVKSYVTAGDWVDKMAKRTGISTTALSELAYACDISGASLGDVEKGVKKMAKSITDADAGLETYLRSFRRIGIDIEELKKMKPEDQFIAIGTAIEGLGSETEKAATAQEIFGRAGTTLLPLFREGKDGIEALRKEAHTLGIVFDTETAAKAAKLKDAQTALSAAFKGVGFALADTLVPAITGLVNKITTTITKVKDWIKEHPALAGGILKVVAAAGVLATVLGPILIMLPALSAGFTMLWAAITGPIGLVVAGIISVVAVVGAGVKVFGEFRKSSADVSRELRELDEQAGRMVGFEEFLRQAKIAGMDMSSFTKALIRNKNDINKTMDQLVAGQIKGAGDLSRLYAKMTEDRQAQIDKETKFQADLAKIEGWAAADREKKKQALEGIKQAESDLASSMKVTTTQIETQALAARNLIAIIGQVPAKLEEWSNATAGAARDLSEHTKWAGIQIERTFENTTNKIREYWNQSLENTLADINYFLNSIDSLFQMNYENSMIRIDNEEKRRLEAIDNIYNAEIEAAEALMTDAEEKTKRRMANLDEWYAKKKQEIENSIIDEDEKKKALAKLDRQLERKRNRILARRATAEESAATALEDLEDAKNEALRISSEDLEKKRAAARRTAAIQEKAVALLSAIVNTAAAVAKALPNIPLAIAVGVLGAVQIALIKSKPIPLAEGGIVTQPTHILAGERGPEAIIPLNKMQPAYAGTGEVIVKQNNYFYGNINNVGDLDDISDRVGRRTTRMIERGRRF